MKKNWIGINAVEENYTNHDVVSVTESIVSHVLYPFLIYAVTLIVPVISNTAKKQAFTVRKTKVEFTENVAIYYRLPVFCLRKLRRFLCVFASVNPSIRSIIR